VVTRLPVRGLAIEKERLSIARAGDLGRNHLREGLLEVI
jgi:hypothetical protein